MAEQIISVLLLGIGNVLWADEGFGVRVVERLQTHYRFPDGVQIVDGGTQGLYLVEHVQQAEILIVFDAIDYGLPSGMLKCVSGAEVPNFLGAKKMSLHQTGFQEVLATAHMLGNYPQHLFLIGVQPQQLEDFGGSLSPAVKAQIQPAIDLALAYLQPFGITAVETQSDQPLTDPVLDLQRYEQERPSPEAACRFGDVRVLESPAFALRPPPAPADGTLQVDVDYRGKYPCA
ncbi:MAG: HyaD/HybD family hydrogenase maturation endopeptidase [Gammaproteobacteria bacterium]